MAKKTVYTEKHVDPSSGEVTAVKFIERSVTTADKFSKTYLDDMGALIKCSNAEKNFILCCTFHKFIEYETNEIVLTQARRERVASCSGISERSVQNIMYRLIAKNIVVRLNKSMFLNPKLFFTGSEIARSKMFELKVLYTIQDKHKRT